MTTIKPLTTLLLALVFFAVLVIATAASALDFDKEIQKHEVTTVVLVDAMKDNKINNNKNLDSGNKADPNGMKVMLISKK